MNNYHTSDRVIGKILDGQAERYANKTLVRTLNTQKTYKEFRDICNQFANGFVNLGLSKGDKVCLMLDNCLEHLYCWFALAKLGIVDVPINTAYKGYILEYIINNSEAKALVVDERYLTRIRSAEKNIPKVRELIVYYPKGQEKKSAGVGFRVTDLQDFFSFPSTPPSITVHNTDLATILYTSGTTGPSKGVMMSHAYCHSFARVFADNFGLSSEDIDYTCLPLFHINARLMCTYACILTGAQVGLGTRFSLSRFWDDIRFFQASVFNALGSIASILCSTPPTPEDGNNAVRRAHIFPLPRNFKEFEQRFDLKISTCYGMTEINIPVFSPIDEELPEGACGKRVQGFELRIANEYDEETPNGQVGEMLVRTLEPYTMLSGYFNMPEKTADAYRNLWFHTGDAMFRDDAGWYYFVDRMKDSIRRRGENISSFEVESVINLHPAVLECAAIAVKDPLLTEDEIKVCVVTRGGEVLIPKDLIRFCEPLMPYFHIPRYVEVMDELPKTATGKIRKVNLRENAVNSNTWDREKAGIKLRR